MQHSFYWNWIFWEKKIWKAFETSQCEKCQCDMLILECNFYDNDEQGISSEYMLILTRVFSQ